MQFLNPLVLFAMAAAAAPLLLHLLQRRKLRPIDFSSLRFLKELQKTTVRRIKLRQWLLLLIRTLIIAFVVLAFARPALRGTIGGLGAHARSTIVILLDNSLSMDARDANGQIFESALRSAQQIADVLEEGDNAALVRMADVDIHAAPQLTHDAALLKREIASTTIVPRVARVHDALRVASALLAGSQNPNKEVYLITDAQRVSFDSTPAALPLFDSRTRVVIVPQGTQGRRTEDLSVDSLVLRTTIFEPGKPLDVDVVVRNTGSDDVSAALVRLTMNGKPVAQRSVHVSARSVATVSLSASLEATGIVGLTATVDDNMIELDNSRSVAIIVPPALRVALLGAKPDASQFVRAALEPDSGARAAFVVTEISGGRVGGLNFDGYDVIVCSDLAAFSSVDAPRLRAFLERGGGVVIFGAGDPSSYNAIARTVGLPSAERLVAPAAPLLFGAIDVNSGFFNGVFEHTLTASNATTVESPHVQSMTRFSEEGASETMIRMANGAPFLMRRNVGQGRVVLCGAAPTMEGSEFPMKPVFVPIVSRSVLFAGTVDAVGPSLEAGEAFELPIRSVVSGPLSVRGADGAETKVQPHVMPSLTVAPLSVPRAVGVYGVYASDGAPVGAFAVNPDVREIDPAVMSTSDLVPVVERMAASPGSVRVVDAGVALAGSITQIRFGVELWRACVYAALLCAVLEMAVARTAKHDAIE